MAHRGMKVAPKSARLTSPSGRNSSNLSTIDEDSNTLTLTDTTSLPSQVLKDTNLKSSDFKSDSLEHFSSTASRHGVTGTKLVPLVDRDAEQTLPSSYSPPPPPQDSNLMINSTNPRHSSSSLPSPNWSHLLFHDESETSTNLITSPIRLNSLPKMFPPDCIPEEARPRPANMSANISSNAGVQRKGFDLGDHCKGSQSGDKSSGTVGEDGEKISVIAWKRGKLLGKGAYGKVWEGLLSSAKIIAVKEVDLDTDNLTRAKSVRYHVHVIMC